MVLLRYNLHTSLHLPFSIKKKDCLTFQILMTCEIIQDDTSELCSNTVFLGSVFVYLASINYRAKLMTKVVYISCMNQRPYLTLIVQFSSVAQSCPTFVTPCTPGFPVHHQLPELTQIHVYQVSDAIQPSHPLSSSSPPAPNPSQLQSLFQ